MQGFITKKNTNVFEIYKLFGFKVAFKFAFGRKKTFLDCLA